MQAPPPSEAAEQETSRQNGQPIRLILVDDDPHYREAVGAELGEHGFTVASFPDGASMFEHFAAGNSADVLVLDWRLPNMSGLDLLGQVRRRGIMLPVIFLTGMPALNYESAALDHGALDFVDKAKGVAILAKRVRLIVEAGKKPPELPAEEIIHCGRLTLRPRISRAFWDGADANLTVTEYNIVQHLTQRTGEFVSYRAIYDCVHHAGFIAGRGDDGFRTNVRSSLKRIRNKFRAIDGSFCEIENFPAFGYRWRSVAIASN